jgi:hypothetical protein
MGIDEFPRSAGREEEQEKPEQGGVGAALQRTGWAVLLFFSFCSFFDAA